MIGFRSLEHVLRSIIRCMKRLISMNGIWQYDAPISRTFEILGSTLAYRSWVLKVRGFCCRMEQSCFNAFW
jgi:hypothetical protein